MWSLAARNVLADLNAHQKRETMLKPKVLFLCTGNSARSQMGEALLRAQAGDRFDVYSAGLHAKGLNPYTVRALAEQGIDTAPLYSKDVNEFLGKVHFAYVITVCGHADEHCPTVWLSGPEKLHWPFEDPAAFVGDDAATLAKFREVRDRIAARIAAWLKEPGIA